MNIFTSAWAWLTALLKNFWAAEAPALTAWLEQFSTDIGKIILIDAEIYGPQIFAGTMTITDAAAKLSADLQAKGIPDVQALGQLIFNALRTQVNAAATAVPAAPTPVGA